MRLSQIGTPALLLFAVGAAQAASSWGFGDAKTFVSSKKGGEEKDIKLSQASAVSELITLGSSDNLKISLTAKHNGKGQRPHQAFLVLREETTGLEVPFPMTVKENGKASVVILPKEIPVPLLLSDKPLKASVIIASFGSAEGIDKPVFNVEIKLDPNATSPRYERPLRYGKQPEIVHIFRTDFKNPPKVISLFFGVVVVATLPALFIGWIALGANVNHLTKALSAAPLAHTAFLGSIIAMEGVFFLYYTSWNLFQTLPVMILVGGAAIFSGSGALGEVQKRRLAGER